MSTSMDSKSHQGGKAWGQLKKKQADNIDAENQDILREDLYQEVEDLEDKLEEFKVKFMEYDADDSGDLGLMDLKLMMEKLGQAKTHLELKKMLAEVDTNNSGTITYREFVAMMLGKKNSILRIILMFEERAKANGEKPKGPPPKKTFDDLP